jgi:putative nucleotidyltransferase with HDIG domain
LSRAFAASAGECDDAGLSSRPYPALSRSLADLPWLCHRERVFRMLELLGGLSVAGDLGTGAPLEESLRRCVVARRLAQAAGCADPEVSDVVYTSLLQHLGCTAYSHEAAEVWGDDIASTRLAFLTDFEDPKDLVRTWVPGIAEATGWTRARALGTTLVFARRFEGRGPVATCEVARDASRRLGLPKSVQDNLFQALAMWNGKGYPPTSGDAIPFAARIMHVASVATLFLHHAGPEAAVAEVRRRAGTYLDPELADTFTGHPELLEGLEELDAYEEVLDSEPDPVRLVDDEQLETVARTFGDLVDLKSPWLRGHSSGVAELAAAAASCLRLDEDVRTVRVAGYLHDLGRVGVSSRIWDKPGPLTRSERDQARLHAYHGERILARVPSLTQVAKLAGEHHERCDGSGYHRGATASQLTMPSRVLAAADAFRELVEARPHRPALSAAEGADRLRAEAKAARLDADAVAAVIQAAGLRAGVRRTWPAQLTERQVEVLRLMAAGLSNREIARRLVISHRTAEHHVQDIYLKIGGSTRAAAALFAMEHGLLAEPG